MKLPEGNGVAERFIRTLKENLLWVRSFQTIEALRLALIEFADWYNTYWLVARHRHTRPDQGRPAAGHGSGRMPLVSYRGAVQFRCVAGSTRGMRISPR